ncbi:atypical chemokine receptor 3-like [Hydractinia symbiolongicarpus]|uniref:atypical chemokine receptor 3-like n=1 Tax=Hydractinia symbiolongicarpus TaxID=13093 RepID=UPI00255099DE|nr:atypical chemokine receptor 3-like [Hydractinia symbiolongicarpus]XP_057297486.1 atypical chemokine receptor 3-like [Hydractinia symbiolongicarpus]
MDDIFYHHFNMSWQKLEELLCNDTRNAQVYNVCAEINQHYRRANNTFMQTDSEDLHKILIAGLFLFIFGMVSNITLLATILSRKRFYKASWSYVCNVTIADILVLISMAVYLFYLYYTPDWPKNLHMYLFPSLDMFLSSASMLSVASISIDRVMTISVWGRIKMNRKKNLPRYIIISIWVYSVFILALAIGRMFVAYNETYNEVVFWIATVVALFASVIATLTCNAIIIFYFVRDSTVCAKIMQSPLLSHLIKDGVGATDDRVRKINEQKNRIHRSFIFIIAPLPFLIGWSFFLGIQTYENVTGGILKGEHINMAMLVVPWVVSVLNPISYIAMSRSVRREMKNCLKRFCRCTYESQVDSETVTEYDVSLV